MLGDGLSTGLRGNATGVAVSFCFSFHSWRSNWSSALSFLPSTTGLTLPTLCLLRVGYILYADDRFIKAIRRDWPLMLTEGILSTLHLMATAAAGVALEWMSTPGIPQFYLGWSVFSVNSWCWAVFVLYVGMRFLDFTNR